MKSSGISSLRNLPSHKEPSPSSQITTDYPQCDAEIDFSDKEEEDRTDIRTVQVERTQEWLESLKKCGLGPPPNGPIIFHGDTLIPPNNPTVSVPRFKPKWKNQKRGGGTIGNSEIDQRNWENLANFDPKVAGQKGKVVIYKISDVFDEDDFTLQKYEYTGLLNHVETTLEEYCEMAYAQNKGKPLILEILHKYAVFNDNIGKWVRCVLIDVVPEYNEGVPTGIFRQLDYGGWFIVALNSEECPGEYVQEVPDIFFKFPMQGATASQSENPILNKRFPIRVLREMKNSLVLGLIQDFFPSKNDSDVPHVNITILNVITVPRRSQALLKRRNSI